MWLYDIFTRACIFVFGIIASSPVDDVNGFFDTQTVSCRAEHCSGSIIFLHGSGSSGVEMRELIRTRLGEDLSFESLQIRFPTAPLQPHTGSGREMRHIWFDRLELEYDSVEQLESINQMGHLLSNLIQHEIESGIQINRIFIGGYSMGGGMSLHEGLRFHENVAGLFGLSSFLNKESQVYKVMETNNILPGQYPPLFLASGDADDTVPSEWTIRTRDRLSKLGLNSTYHEIKGMVGHDVTREELILLKQWIRETFHNSN